MSIERLNWLIESANTPAPHTLSQNNDSFLLNDTRYTEGSLCSADPALSYFTAWNPNREQPGFTETLTSIQKYLADFDQGDYGAGGTTTTPPSLTHSASTPTSSGASTPLSSAQSHDAEWTANEQHETERRRADFKSLLTRIGGGISMDQQLDIQMAVLSGKTIVPCKMTRCGDFIKLTLTETGQHSDHGAADAEWATLVDAVYYRDDLCSAAVKYQTEQVTMEFWRFELVSQTISDGQRGARPECVITFDLAVPDILEPPTL